MRYRPSVQEAAAALVYLTGTSLLSYLVWGPWDGVDPTVHAWWVYGLVLVLHAGVGAWIGRWWAVALPILWAVISIPAGGYDTPLVVVIAFQTPLFWAPAILIGVVARRLARRHVRDRRLTVSRSS
ncbi:MAG: hypothetical protein E6G67_00450 [Actinobacteria bacterium]|nr:MAG: hypothetical protein E6G67_00450 [Actinomycetota bacterium]